MSFGAKLSSFLFEQPVEPTPTPMPVQVKNPPAQVPSFTAEAVCQNGENKFLDLLQGILSKESALSNFLKEVESMADVIPDSGMRFKAVAKMQKVDKTAITLAVQQHLADLQQEQNNFLTFYENAKKNATDLIENGKKNTLDLVAAKNAEILALREKIAACEKSIEDINTTQHALVSEQTSVLGKLEQNKMLFNIAYQSVTGNVNSQASLINSTI